MGPSSGISTVFADARVDLVVAPLALRAADVAEPRGARVEGRPGMFAVWLAGCVVV